MPETAVLVLAVLRRVDSEDFKHRIPNVALSDFDPRVGVSDVPINNTSTRLGSVRCCRISSALHRAYVRPRPADEARLDPRLERHDVAERQPPAEHVVHELRLSYDHLARAKSIRIELVLHDEQLDLSMRVADVAIWAREPQQSDLIRRPLFTMHLHAYASTAYVRKFGAPQTLEQLDKHRLVALGGRQPQHLAAINWLETAGREGREPRVPIFRSNSVLAQKYAVSSGIGIGLLPDYLTAEENDLVLVLRDTELPTLPIYFVFPEELKSAKKVQVFRDFLVANARQWKF